MLSKPDYCETVYYLLPEFQLKRLQRVQLVAASFVLSRYVNDINDIVKIGWLREDSKETSMFSNLFTRLCTPPAGRLTYH